jgi:flavin reductase (DIM6/NTAB) family NADH-FMN oxidoreductase RutF/DNA-binding transcriptional LysR family regulator
MPKKAIPVAAAPDPDLKNRFLLGMSHAAATVNIVTTDGKAGRYGVTVSAMSSVSADTEKPTMLVCVNETSSSCKPILANGVFCVNVLRDDQASISDYFAGRFKTADGDKFSCATWTTQKTGAPRLVDPLVAFDCKIIDTYKIGTHHVLIGAVQDVYVHDSGSALIYANRAYRTALRLPSGPVPAAGPSEALKLGAYHTFAPYVIPEIMGRLAADSRTIDLRLIEGDQKRIMDGLAAGDVDVALIHDFWQLPPDVVTEQLAPLTPYVLLADNHPLADKPSLSLAELAKAPMVLLDASPGGEMTLGLFKDRCLTPNVRFRSSLFEMVRGMVGHGLGYAILVTRPAFNMTYDGRALTTRPLDEKIPPRHMAIAWRKDRPPSGIAKAFLEAARSGA